MVAASSSSSSVPGPGPGPDTETQTNADAEADVILEIYPDVPEEALKNWGLTQDQFRKQFKDVLKGINEENRLEALNQALRELKDCPEKLALQDRLGHLRATIYIKPRPPNRIAEIFYMIAVDALAFSISYTKKDSKIIKKDGTAKGPDASIILKDLPEISPKSKDEARAKLLFNWFKIRPDKCLHTQEAQQFMEFQEGKQMDSKQARRAMQRLKETYPNHFVLEKSGKEKRIRLNLPQNDTGQVGQENEKIRPSGQFVQDQAEREAREVFDKIDKSVH